MQHPIRALRVTSDRSGSHTHGEVEIRPTRGNADLLGMIARRARTLMSVQANFGIATLRAENTGAGALGLSAGPMRSMFAIREVHFDLARGRAPNLTLVGHPASELLVLNALGEFDLAALAQGSTTPLDESGGEVECPSCGFVNTRAALLAPHNLGCPECGNPAQAILASVQAEAA